VADAETACRRLDQHEAQLSNMIGLLDDERGAYGFAADFRDPAAFPPSIEYLDELRREAGYEKITLWTQNVLVARPPNL
jgi:hypothetical protein